jgi:type IV pilus secretin PilQ/predicted competence protein
MNTNVRAKYAALMLTMAMLCLATVTAASGIAPTVQVKAVVEANQVRFEATGNGPFEYTTHRPTERLFVVDFSGTAPGVANGARVLDSEIVSSYRVLQYRSGDRAIVRLEVLMRSPAEPKVEKAGPSGLLITFAAADSSARASEPVVSRPAQVAMKSAPAIAATLIQAVQVNRGQGGASVQIRGNGQLRYETLRLNNPDRLVLDFAGTRLSGVAREVAGADPVRGVRSGQFKPDVSRIVVDLANGTPYTIHPGQNSITVDFGVASAAAVERKMEEREVTVAPLKAASPVRRAAASPAHAPEVSNNSAVAALMLPANLTGDLRLGSPMPAARPEPIPAPAAAVPAARPSARSQGPYGGEPISVNFKDIDLKDFFRLVHEISGLNVVVDPAVAGKVTIVLDEVPWDQALDIVLRNNSLDKQLEGNVLRIATKATLKKEAEERRDLAKAEAEAVPQETMTRTLSYAKASGVRDTLRRFLSPRGEVLADERSNTLVIRDIPGVFPTLNTLMDQLDRKTQQVEIEARVVSATRTFAREIGTQFGFATTAAGGRSVFGGLVGNNNFVSPVERGTALPPPPLVSSGTNSIPLNTNLGASAPTSGASFAHASPNFALDFIISAAESKGVGKLLSRPKVITQNNEKAVVKQGTKVPIQTVINNTISVQFIDAVLKLEVTPQITAEGTIFMEVLVENTAIDEGIPRVQGIPALTTQAAETKVLIDDGGTVVVGGIMISSQRTDVAQVPLLGSIPIIGHLFKRTAVSSNSQELLFFLTPRIVPN